MPFSLIISTLRRQKLLNAIKGEGKEKEEGEKVMQAYGKLLALRKAAKPDKSETQSQKSSKSFKSLRFK